MGFYRLLVGSHIGAGPVKDVGGVATATDRVYYADDNSRNIVESEADLARRWPEKFAKYDGPPPTYNDSITGAPERKKQAPADDELNSMSVKQLREMAVENEIDLVGCDKKDEIIARIKEMA